MLFSFFKSYVFIRKHCQTPSPFIKHLYQECQNEKFLFHQTQSILTENLVLKKLFSSRINVPWWGFLELLNTPEFRCGFYSSCPHNQAHVQWCSQAGGAVSLTQPSLVLCSFPRTATGAQRRDRICHIVHAEIFQRNRT